MGSEVKPPVPDLEAHPITFDEYYAFTPEKFELYGGYLFAPADDDWYQWRRGLLRLLLVNEGLVEAVRLAPRERWLEALRRVYGQ